MSFFTSLTDFWRYDFLAYALFGTLILSFCSGILSPFVVAKKYAFLGEGIAHSNLFGLSLSLLIFSWEQTLAVYLTNLAFILFFLSFLARATYRQKLPSDSLIGIFLTATLSAGIIVHSLWGETRADLLSFLFGNILLLEQFDLLMLSILLSIIIILVVKPLPNWLYFTFDEEGAYVAGVPTKRLHYTFFFLLGLVIVSSIKLAGTLLVTTLLIIPGAFSFKYAHNTRQVFFSSVVFSLLASLLGLILANWLGLAPGATLAFAHFVCFGCYLGYRRISQQ